jgi:hypothetical protein
MTHALLLDGESYEDPGLANRLDVAPQISKSEWETIFNAQNSVGGFYAEVINTTPLQRDDGAEQYRVRPGRFYATDSDGNILCVVNQRLA